MRLHSSSSKTIAIRRETYSIWERRAPLAPSHVRRLTANKVRVLVQPSNRRACSMQEYVQAGAIIQEDISEASVILGVKQVRELSSQSSGALAGSGQARLFFLGEWVGPSNLDVCGKRFAPSKTT